MAWIDPQRSHDIIVFLIIQAFVVIAFFVAFIFQKNQTALNQFVTTIGPLIVIIGITVAVIVGDKKRMQRHKESGEEDKAIRINKIIALKHDVLIYSATLLVLVAPFILADSIKATDVIQAGLAFIFLSLTKRLYWRE